MAKQRMIVTDDQLLIDMDLLFNAIREAGGNWEQVEQEMQAYLASIQTMAMGAEPSGGPSGAGGLSGHSSSEPKPARRRPASRSPRRRKR